jgi:DNA-binding XRE family transcriptional regulator
MDESKKGRPGLKALRLRLDMTQAELAHRLNTAEKTIRNWENAQAIPSFETAVALAKLFGISLKSLAEEFGLDVGGIPDDFSDPEGGDHPDRN